MNASITETCSCGATFTATANTSSMLDYSAKKWRESHKHAESVGICGDRPPPIKLGDMELERPHCALKAGHEGMHADDHGGHWTIYARDLAEQNARILRHESETDPRGHDDNGECCRRARIGEAGA